MKIKKLSIAALPLLLVLAGCAPVSQSYYEKRGQTPIPTAKILELLGGKTLHLESIDFSASVQFNNNMTVSAKDLSGTEDSGKWSVEPEDLVCIKFNSWYYGDKNCYRIIEDKDDILFFSSNGAIRYTGTTGQREPNEKAPKSTSIQEDKRNIPKQDSSIVPPSRKEEEPAKDRFARLAKNCPGCNLSGVDLSGAELANANLAGANLSGADLTGANLRLANLSGANLSNARMIRANLPGANLTGADLTDADLTGSNLIRADVTNAILKNTEFSGAHLESIQGKTE